MHIEKNIHMFAITEVYLEGKKSKMVFQNSLKKFNNILILQVVVSQHIVYILELFTQDWVVI